MRPRPFTGHLLAALLLGAVPAARADVAPVDSSATLTRWGPLPARSDSTEAVLEPLPTPWWATALSVPYHILGVPLTMVDQGIKGTFVTLDRLGALQFATDVVGGFRGPLETYWLPEFAVGDAEGVRYGLVGRRVTSLLGGTTLRLGLATSTRHANDMTLGALWQRDPSRWFEIGAGTRETAIESYYGLGVGTSQDGESHFERTTDWVGFSFRQDLGAPEFLLGALYSTADAQPAEFDTEESLEVVHAGDLPPGWNERSSGVGLVARLAYDTTDETGRPSRGVRLSGGAQTFLATDDSERRFTTVRLAAETFHGLFLPQRTLALKAFVLRQYEGSGGPIPFQRRLNNHTPDRLRGYRSARFYALGLIGGTVEYRWPVWARNRPSQMGVDAYIFTDVGQPFDHTDEIAWRNLLATPGVGVRVIDDLARFALRFEVAFSQEGPQLHLTASQVFQYIKTGFYDGTEPVPILR